MRNNHNTTSSLSNNNAPVLARDGPQGRVVQHQKQALELGDVGRRRGRAPALERRRDLEHDLTRLEQHRVRRGRAQLAGQQVRHHALVQGVLRRHGGSAVLRERPYNLHNAACTEKTR